ncbi:MAG: hypothetical protein IPK75_20240 [Acidobacteria bacterium]|nr:hypothetical protein [Acidobacteriota bacterium]
MVTLGGIVGTVLRLVQDYTPLGQYAQLSGMVRGDSGMGFLAPTTFFVPLAPADGRGATSAQMALPAAVTDLVRSRPSAPAQGVSGVSRYSRGSRFA